MRADILITDHNNQFNISDTNKIKIICIDIRNDAYTMMKYTKIGLKGWGIKFEEKNISHIDIV